MNALIKQQRRHRQHALCHCWQLVVQTAALRMICLILNEKKGNLATNGASRQDCDGDGKKDVDVCKTDQPTNCNYENYDYVELRKHLAKLKAGAEQERKVMIMAEEGIPFEVVVGVMDIARDMKTESGETKELFPDVVLSPGFQ